MPTLGERTTVFSFPTLELLKTAVCQGPSLSLSNLEAVPTCPSNNNKISFLLRICVQVCFTVSGITLLPQDPDFTGTSTCQHFYLNIPFPNSSCGFPSWASPSELWCSQSICLFPWFAVQFVLILWFTTEKPVPPFWAGFEESFV